ncbi:sulfite exporter TauE/SafE family protein [Acidithiobacillus sp. AMEEHan]|uniref:sulfite exporter TauE/SafE family protein n=1 Tax=Acidithiobacillus sp. AMEEHan TaxID=2994951 RepID=UPI0027E4F551|nr:sulfite exporter TauE/SafE family protein [Acidithiobacillus sp. AMEEHan]
MLLSALQNVECVLSGMVVGFSLGLIGGGGSILAVPLLLYFVGVSDAHIVIGTTALAVGLNALMNLIPHARAGNVLWKPAIHFALAGVIGALIGAEIGKIINGHVLLIFFALLMLVVAYSMYRQKGQPPQNRGPVCQHHPCVYAYGGGVGLLSGFFGIGGGFLIVPALIRSARMTILQAVGSSLLAVGVLGLATASSYAWSGLVDWSIAGEYLLGGLVGGWLGARTAERIGKNKAQLNFVFVTLITFVAIYMIWKEIYSI